MNSISLYLDEDGERVWYDSLYRYHRIDGPAVEHADGSKKWFIHGDLHREDGPAIEWRSGNKEWYVNDELHRIDGPAVEYVNGTKKWYLEDINYIEEEYWKAI